MVEPKPEYAERLKREKIREDFLADIQIVLNKWVAEIEGTYDGTVNYTVYSPLFEREYDPEKLLVQFQDSRLAANPNGQTATEPQRLKAIIKEAMKLMRDSGADEREYVVYAVLSGHLTYFQP